MTEVYSAGFPHSEISGSMDICSSPKLIAAYHVFRRLSVPRHPPYALCSLTTVLIVRVRLAPFPYHLTFWFKVYVWFVWISCLLNLHSLMKLNWFHYLVWYLMMSTYNYLYALSYVVFKVQSSSLFDQRLGLSGLEPPTSRLSGVRSNRLSYKPLILASTCFPMPSPA